MDEVPCRSEYLSLNNKSNFHALKYAKKYADKVIMLDKSIVAKGKPAEVFESKIFKNVIKQIFYHSPDTSAVCININILFGRTENRG